MNAFVDFLFAFVFAAASVGAFGYLGFLFIQKARASNRSESQDDDGFIPIALCETRNGIKTHYHKLEDFGALNYSGYPIKGHPTLCGAEVGWDMQNQDAEATCETCREGLAKMARETA